MAGGGGDAPTIINSTGMKMRRAWNRTLRAGQPGDFIRRQVRGERTRVSHAATVSVHTRKYLWALRWGGRLREGGSWSMRLGLDMMGKK